jgi:hypothetical protein
MNFEEDFADFEEIVGDHGRSGERVAQCGVSSQERIESQPDQAEDERSLARAWELFQGKFISLFIFVLLQTVSNLPSRYGTVVVLKIHISSLPLLPNPFSCSIEISNAILRLIFYAASIGC